MARVVIPENPEKALRLAEKVMAKHTADGAASPLNTLNDHTWAANGPKVAQALALEAQAKQLEKDVENLYKQRNALIAPVKETLRSSRDLLLAAYKTNPKKLGEWGFEVNDTPQPKKKEDPKP